MIEAPLLLQKRLKKHQIASQSTWETIEKDYLLSWILYGIAQECDARLVFKGGTALKKCFFGDYRFSEDLDFTALSPKGNFEDLIRSTTERLNTQLGELEEFEIESEQYFEKKPHPEGQEAYVFKARFGWHRLHRSKEVGSSG